MGQVISKAIRQSSDFSFSKGKVITTDMNLALLTEADQLVSLSCFVVGNTRKPCKLETYGDHLRKTARNAKKETSNKKLLKEFRKLKLKTFCK